MCSVLWHTYHGDADHNGHAHANQYTDENEDTDEDTDENGDARWDATAMLVSADGRE